MASNILLLASKICFLTSQGLVGVGMNCKSTNQKRKLPVVPCLLTDWEEMSNLYRGPSIDASY